MYKAMGRSMVPKILNVPVNQAANQATGIMANSSMLNNGVRLL